MGISLHKFPSEGNKELRKQWIHKLKLGKVPKIALACSRHFTKEDYISPSMYKFFEKILRVPK